MTKSNLNASLSEPLTADILREEVRQNIESFRKNVFKSLHARQTESILIYLISISLAPLERSFRLAPSNVSNLIKTIFPTNYNILEHYFSKGHIDVNALAASVEKLLESDPNSSNVFENLLIFTDIVPLIEDTFRNQEWVIQELRSELLMWQRIGRLQRLQVTMPSENYIAPATSRGDLQFLISASKPTIVAGEEFSVFVVINNPFDVPITLYSVETQIPVELIDVVAQERRRASFIQEVENEREMKAQNARAGNDSLVGRIVNTVTNNISVLESFRMLADTATDAWRVDLKMRNQSEGRIAQAVAASEDITRNPDITLRSQVEVGHIEGGNATVIGTRIEKYRSVEITIESASPGHLDQLLWRIDSFKRGLTPITLQPGNSVVKQFIFRTKSWLLFTPLAHTMQIQVRYNVDNRDQLDTIPFALTIQAAITATMMGAVIGGAIGGIARLLSDMQTNATTANLASQGLSLGLAIILSAITVVSFARKSGVQQIVSIEDFWGGLFLGFLIGFFGQNYALNLITPKPTI